MGRDIDVNSGNWTARLSMIGALADSYYEYLYKAYVLFGDEELKEIWDPCIASILTYLSHEDQDRLWFAKCNMDNGHQYQLDVTLWDAYFPGVLAMSDHLDESKKNLDAWDYLWNLKGIVPQFYDVALREITDPYYQLNPEVIESTYYLYSLTGEEKYLERLKVYYSDIKSYCKTEIAFTNLKSVVTKEQDDMLPTFFFAETMKYFYLAFTDEDDLSFDRYVFTTEAHPFKKSNFEPSLLRESLLLR